MVVLGVSPAVELNPAAARTARSLNGVCLSSGRCKCDVPWTAAANCSLLDFQPVPSCFPGGGCGLQDGSNSTWGGSVWGNASSGFWMAAARFTNGCPLSSWQSNSEVIVAHAPEAQGPYVPRAVVTHPWAHNPAAVVAPEPGTGEPVIVVFTLGNGRPNGPQKDCRSPDSGGPAPASAPGGTSRAPIGAGGAAPGRGIAGGDAGSLGKYDPASLNFTLWWSRSPLGPWAAHETYFSDALPDGSLANWNPSPRVLPDGSVRVMVHTDASPWGGEVFAEAPSWRGPYRFVTGDFMPAAKTEEDPFAWVDARGHHHVLLHRMFDPPGAGPIPSPGWAGGHSFSRDGLVWSPVARAYNTSVLLQGGGTMELARRERPKLIFAADGVTPTHLTNGVLPTGPDARSWTLVTPLASAGPGARQPTA